MEDYLSYMKTLHSRMNEVEDQAAKITVGEEMHFTTIQNTEKDLNFGAMLEQYQDISVDQACIWQEVLADNIISEIFKKHGGHFERVYTLDDCLMRRAVRIISYTVNGASSPDEI